MQFVETEAVCPICGESCVSEWKEGVDEPDYEQDGCRA